MRRRSRCRFADPPRLLTRLAAAVALTATLAVPAAAAPPGAGVLVPGRSLGGIALGMTKPAVESRWGRAYGVCRSCTRETWYFNYYAFQPGGTGVEWKDGRAAGVFTIYQPLGWRTQKGLALGDSVQRLTALYGPLPRVDCNGYSAYTIRGRRVTTAFYVLGDRLWAFAISRPGVPLCR